MDDLEDDRTYSLLPSSKFVIFRWGPNTQILEIMFESLI